VRQLRSSSVACSRARATHTDSSSPSFALSLHAPALYGQVQAQLDKNAILALFD
jgi:hypothetical protein